MSETADIKPTKRRIDALEKLFAAEIHGRLPFQSRAKVFQELCDEGLAEKIMRVFGSGFTAVRVDGYALTQRGHMFYCCNSLEPEGEP